MFHYRASYTYRSGDGRLVSSTRNFTYPAALTTRTDLFDVAEYMIGILVCGRDLKIIAVTPVAVIAMDTV